MKKRDNIMGEVILRVEEARQRDFGRGKVRINDSAMKKIGVNTGDVVEIIGKKKTGVIVWPAYIEDQDADIIRLDPIIRRNAGVSLGESVRVRKCPHVNVAKEVNIAPTKRITTDYGFETYVKRKLLGHPLTVGDTILIPVLRKNIPFIVKTTLPGDIVLVTETTRLNVSKKPVIDAEFDTSTVTYEDIRGLRDIIQKMRAAVELPLKHPQLFNKWGVDPPKGVLLYGPPGSGKTLITRAVANKIDAYLIQIQGYALITTFYNKTETLLNDIYEDAKENAPSIILIEDLNVIAPQKKGEVERRVLAQILALMDDLEGHDRVIVIGETPQLEAIDPELRRPGRFEIEIEIDVPDKSDRREILQILTRRIPGIEDVNLNELAENTPGFVGADLAALVRKATIKCLQELLGKIDPDQDVLPPELLDNLKIEQRHFDAALKEIRPSAPVNSSSKS